MCKNFDFYAGNRKKTAKRRKKASLLSFFLWRFRIPEHMKSKHPKEDRVARLMNFNAKVQRNEINEGFKKLQLEGDMAANQKSLMSVRWLRGFTCSQLQIHFTSRNSKSISRNSKFTSRNSKFISRNS